MCMFSSKSKTCTDTWTDHASSLFPTLLENRVYPKFLFGRPGAALPLHFFLSTSVLTSSALPLLHPSSFSCLWFPSFSIQQKPGLHTKHRERSSVLALLRLSSQQVETCALHILPTTTLRDNTAGGSSFNYLGLSWGSVTLGARSFSGLNSDRFLKHSGNCLIVT